MANGRFLLLLFMLCLLARHAAAQSWESVYQELMTTDELEAADWEATSELLSAIEQHPIDLNHATREELEQLPFLSEQDVADILEYVYRYGPMKSAGELAMIERLDYQKRRLLLCFVTTDGGQQPAKTFPTLKNMARYGHHQLMYTAHIPTYRRQGDREGYRGYALRHDVRYDFSYADRVRIGLVGAQDAGEPFLANKNKAGYDFYSAYAVVRRMGIVQSLAVGKYRYRAGMGLVVNTGFAPGKAAMLQMLGRSGEQLLPHASRSQASYMQGAAATVQLVPHLTLTALCSWRPIDATMAADSAGQAVMRTIRTDGYHRTDSELERKNNAHTWTAAAHVQYQGGGLRAGLTAATQGLSHPLQPNTAQVYRRHHPAGQHFSNIGTDYAYTHARFALSGETALSLSSPQTAIATINTASLRIGSTLQLMLLQRFYSMHYTSLLARSFSEGGRVQNESGIYAGFSYTPLRRLVVDGYADVAYFPWPRYQVSQASHAFDSRVGISYTTRGGWTLSARYRLRIRERDNSTKTALCRRTEHRARCLAGYDGGSWSMRLQADGALTHGDTLSRGWMVSHRAALHCRSLHLYTALGYFHTDDYNSCLYAYEPGMRYAFSFPAYYGRGLRYALILRADLSRRYTFALKCGTTNYLDRSTTGTGLQRTDHSATTDIDLQLCLKL